MQKNTSVTLGKYFEDFIAQPNRKWTVCIPQAKLFGRA